MIPKRILSWLLVFFLGACGGSAPNINVGQAAPAFQAVDSGGRTVQFPSGFSGRPLVIRFWADWCRYCEGEMKEIEKVYRRHHGQGLEVLAVNVGQDSASVDAFMRKIGVSYPAVVDEKAVVAKSYGVVGLPTTFFVDGKGVIRAKIVGESDEASFERQASELLR
jgi:peroxiredoxin